jgi:hypothetical protein
MIKTENIKIKILMLGESGIYKIIKVWENQVSYLDFLLMNFV